MFWSGETLRERLKELIEPFDQNRVDCAAYTLSVGPEAYVSPTDQTIDSNNSHPFANSTTAKRSSYRRASLLFY